MYSKIKSQKALVRIVQSLKRKGKKIVTFNGSFDLLHAGHASALEAARKKGDVLIVLLNSDSSVRLYKGPLRPITPQKERAALLASLASVDYVTIFDELTPEAVLSRIQPHIHCKSADYGKAAVERRVIEENGGEIQVVPFTRGLSSSRIIRKIISAYAVSPQRAVFLDRDGTINVRSESGYVFRKEDFRPLPRVIPALQALSRTDYKIIVITNQGGAGKGYYTIQDIERLHSWMSRVFRAKSIRLDKIYYCPHHPDDRCPCRKPGTAMLLQAAQDFGISLNNSWLIGDDEKDVEAGRRANIKTIKIGKRMPRELKLEPHYYARDLYEAAKKIL